MQTDCNDCTANDIPNSGRQLNDMLSILLHNEIQSKQHIHMVPSENILSPLAQLPYMLNAHGRYFLNDYERFNTWFFPGGQQFEVIEKEWLLPLLQELTTASHVNVRPISGMNCMTIMLAALTEASDTVYSIPPEFGGHVSTSVVAKRFGLQLKMLPFIDQHTLNLEQLRVMLIRDQPRLIYVDQSTFLFPIDPWPIRQLIDEVSPDTLIHYDSSHANGLIIGKAMFNPLQRGAHVMGGSTHKTLPGPHKGFIATNCSKLAVAIENMANHFVSHHHPSSMLSLLITLLEMKHCGGQDYAEQIILNAKAFARTLDPSIFFVAASDLGYTNCHQLWVATNEASSFSYFSDKLIKSGIIINKFNDLPGINSPALRLSLAELTKLGFNEQASCELAILFNKLASENLTIEAAQKQVQSIRHEYPMAKYCFTKHDIDDTNSELIKNILKILNSLSN